jgi:hypothetical protein
MTSQVLRASGNKIFPPAQPRREIVPVFPSPSMRGSAVQNRIWLSLCSYPSSLQPFGFVKRSGCHSCSVWKSFCFPLGQRRGGVCFGINVSRKEENLYEFAKSMG